MPRAAVKNEPVNQEVAEQTPVSEKKKIRSIDEIRSKSKIDILLPLPMSSDEGDLYEFVTVNGVTTQLKRGVPLTVNWKIFEVLTNPMTGQYKPNNILR